MQSVNCIPRQAALLPVLLGQYTSNFTPTNLSPQLFVAFNFGFSLLGYAKSRWFRRILKWEMLVGKFGNLRVFGDGQGRISGIC